MVNSGEGTKLLEAAKAFRPRILADRERIEAERRLPEDLVRALAHAGFFRIFLPAAYGGLDLTPMAAAEVFEELARADASVAWCVWNGNTYWTTVRWAKQVALAIFADPDTILANSTRPSGRAVVVEGGYRVSGRWSLVSGCQFSAWFILMCIVHEDGGPRLTPSGAPEFRFMLCPAADLRHRGYLDRRRIARHREPRCRGAGSVRTGSLCVVPHGPAGVGRSTVQGSSYVACQSWSWRDGPRHCAGRDRGADRTGWREAAGKNLIQLLLFTPGVGGVLGRHHLTLSDGKAGPG